MSIDTKLDEFLSSQGSGFTATIETLPDKPTQIRVTPFLGESWTGRVHSFELPRDAIRSVTPTGKYHFCCGKRLEIVVVEFAENASIPVADLIKRMGRPGDYMHAVPPHGAGASHVPAQAAAAQRGQGIVGRWPVPGLPCEIVCIEVCTRFCSPVGWDCCQWETRCGINCNLHA
jgi:hypothetical protein